MVREEKQLAYLQVHRAYGLDDGDGVIAIVCYRSDQVIAIVEKTQVSVGTLAGEGRHNREAYSCPLCHDRSHGQICCRGPVHQRQIFSGALLYGTDGILESGICEMLDCLDLFAILCYTDKM